MMDNEQNVVEQTKVLCSTFKDTVLMLTEKNQKFAYRVIRIQAVVIIAILGFFLTLYVTN